MRSAGRDDLISGQGGRGRRSFFSTLALLGAVVVTGCGDEAFQPAPAAPVTKDDSSSADELSRRTRPDGHHAPTRSPLGANACAPKNVPFAPRAWVPPGPTHVAACTAEQARAVAACIWSTATEFTPACNTFWDAPANQTCLTCAYSSAGDAVHGPIFDDGTFITNNTPACVAAASGDRGATSCAARFEALLDCYGKACSHCESDAAYAACSEAADEGMCKPYRDGWTCADAYAATCSADTTLDASVKIISLLCAP